MECSTNAINRFCRRIAESIVICLIDVADKAFLDIGNAFAQGRREHQDRDEGENAENNRRNDSNGAGIDSLKNSRNKNNAQDIMNMSELTHYPEDDEVISELIKILSKQSREF